MIVDRDRVLASWLKRWPASSDETNRMSNSGHPCDRYLYLRRTDGEMQAPPSEYMAAVFKRGTIAQDTIAKAQILAAGYELYEQEQRFTVIEKGETLWRGHIDGVIRDPKRGRSAPVHVWEAKIINTHTWKGINSLEDMLKSPKHWIRGYPAQISLYMYAKQQADVGVLHLVDSETWLPKFIEVPMNYQYVQELLDRGKRINAAVKARQIPDPIDWGETCERCSLLAVCLPDQMAAAGGLQVWEKPGFEAKLLLRERLKADLDPLKKQFDAVDKEIKDQVRDQGEIVVGDFWMRTKVVPVKGYSVDGRNDHRVEIKRYQGAAGASEDEVA